MPDGVARLGPGGAVAEIVAGIDGDELVVVEGEPDAPARVHDLGRAALADRSLRSQGDVTTRRSPVGERRGQAVKTTLSRASGSSTALPVTLAENRALSLR